MKTACLRIPPFIFALGLVATGAFAQGGQGGRFADIDANGDGVISRSEMTSNAESVFYAMDADGSGKLTKDEYMSVRMGQQTGANTAMQTKRQAEKAARFAPMDKDGDALVSLDEFVAGAAARFDAADANGDGRLIRPEWRNARF